jgi:hypothetical protein
MSVGWMFMTGFKLSGTFAGGALATLVFVSHYKFATQVQWSPTLRECWALPCFHILLYLLVHWLQSSKVTLMGYCSNIKRFFFRIAEKYKVTLDICADSFSVVNDVVTVAVYTIFIIRKL